ncbi:hypothetical protein GmHk_07G019653 [Glycine max]|nr:hypothetical protein GmHk_07G019653 [Glycine max]
MGLDPRRRRGAKDCPGKSVYEHNKLTLYFLVHVHCWILIHLKATVEFTSFSSLMGTQNYNMFDAPYKYMVPEDKDFLNKSLPLLWTPSIQVYNNYEYAPTPFLNQQVADAALVFSEIVHRTHGEQNLNSIKNCARNLQPKSLITNKSRENGSKSSIMKTDRDGVLCSEANANKGSPNEDHITNVHPQSSIVRILQDIVKLVGLYTMQHNGDCKLCHAN